MARSEFEFIDSLRRRFGAAIGDDAALFQSTANKETVITADLLIEDIDFRRTTAPPTLLGHKALAVSLSDLAAMGARPRWSLIAIGVPEDVWETDFVNQFYEGLTSLANRYDVKLIGGDTSRTPDKIVIDSIAIGECNVGQAVKRAGAQPGDQIFLTGSLGGAAAGLRLIERGAHLAEQNLADDDSQKIDHVLLRQLRPEPRVGWGMVLGEERLATALIDISDGLSSDLNHLCRESGVGALIESSFLPIDHQVVELCGRRALDPLQLALHGGEDFELLFTVRAGDVARLPRRVDGTGITRIGEVRIQAESVKISEGSRIWELNPGGWKHF
ncbi:MAG TPA: thiamine-phosphate kinase [Pyrinomonadaceae bacterium]|nr:thiamine-phosphate kinase [Pyrinomonadaceae bacterium]